MTHTFTWEKKKTGDCGAHGCHGHADYTVTCTCGWTETFKNEYWRPSEVDLLLKHHLDYLEAQCLTR